MTNEREANKKIIGHEIERRVVFSTNSSAFALHSHILEVS